MIKLNSILRLTFSTLKFPEQYMRTFKLNRQVRSCISLQQLKELVQTQDAQIQLYGKTIILEYLNEIPINYTFRSINSPIIVFKYGFALRGLTTYEQQLRYAIISKLLDYVTRDAWELERMLKMQEEKMVKLIKEQPFDIVDALNWILFQRNKMQNELVEHSLTVICSTPIERSESLMTKLLNSFLKKIEDMPWNSLRKFNKIFEFICNKYQLSIESPKVMVANLEKLVNLKLHMIGYDRIPRAVDQICKRIDSELEDLDLYCLQIIFRCFESLPTNYNRKLFTKIYNRILSLMSSDIFELQSLPLSRLTKQQMDSIMKKHFNKNFTIKDTIYFINSENASSFFASNIFLTSLEEQFMKPVSYLHQTKASYVGYFSTGRTLLDYYSTNQHKKEQIYTQLEKIHKLSLADENYIKVANLFTSLCGWFNIYSIELQHPFLGQFKTHFLEVFQETINRFLAKKFSSNWKAKKHYLQIREILTKHANSKFPEIQNLILSIVEKDIKLAQKYDSMAYPYYIYLLETAEDTTVYKKILKKIYEQLKGQYAFSFLDSYIRYPKKSAKLNTALMLNLWSLNKDPKMILKILAGVPSVYFQDGVIGLLSENAVIIEDLAIFLRNGDLDDLSQGEIASILRFCRSFLKKIRIFSNKMLLLTINIAAHKIHEIKLGKNQEVEIEFINELVQLCVELGGSEQTLAIEKISALLKQMEQENKDDSFFMLRMMEVKFLLKRSIPINEAAIKDQIKLLTSRYIKQQLPDKSKVLMILLKLHTLQEITLDDDTLAYCVNFIKDSIDKEWIDPSDIQGLLGSSFFEQCTVLRKDNFVHIKEVVNHALQDTKIQQKEDYYIFYLKFADKIKASDIIRICAERLCILPLQPPYVITICSILKFDTAYYNPILIDRILKDTFRSFSILQPYLLDIFNYINIICYKLPQQFDFLYPKMFQSIEKSLIKKVNAIMMERSPDQEQLNQVLTMTYKYYWIAISTGLVNENTYKLFKMNVRFISQIQKVLIFKKFECCTLDIIIMIHHYLFREREPEIKQPLKERSTFFSSRKQIAPVISKEDEEYYKHFQVMRSMQKPPARNYQFENQLRNLNIYQKTKFGQEEAFFTFALKQKGLQTHYYVRFEGKGFYIFFTRPQMKNKSGLYKGRIRLTEHIYKSAFQNVQMIEQGELQVSLK